MSAAGDQKAKRETAARLRACFDNDITHIRAGDWSGTNGATVSFIGMASDMHGSICTCCPRPGGDAA